MMMMLQQQHIDSAPYSGSPTAAKPAAAAAAADARSCAFFLSWEPRQTSGEAQGAPGSQRCSRQQGMAMT